MLRAFITNKYLPAFEANALQVNFALTAVGLHELEAFITYVVKVTRRPDSTI